MVTNWLSILAGRASQVVLKALSDRGRPFAYVRAGNQAPLVQLREHKVGIFLHALIMFLKGSIIVIEKINKIGRSTYTLLT